MGWTVRYREILRKLAIVDEGLVGDQAGLVLGTPGVRVLELKTAALVRWAEDRIAELRPRYPKWDIWYVPLYPTGTAWCAKPVGAPTATINADSPEALVTAIREQEAEPSP